MTGVRTAEGGTTAISLLMSQQNDAMSDAVSQCRGASLGHLLDSVLASVIRPGRFAASAPLGKRLLGPSHVISTVRKHPCQYFLDRHFLDHFPISVPVMIVFTSLFFD